MKMGLHSYANGQIVIQLKCENDAERGIVDFFIGKGGSIQPFKGTGDSCNGLGIETGKFLKK